MTRRFATVDVGTNTTLLLAVEVDDAGAVTVLDDRAEITRLGRGIGGDGRLGEDGIARTLAALRTYGEAARALGCGERIAAVGTEALRRAPNAAAFLDPAREALGVPIEVISGEREAALTFRATVASFPELARDRMAVVDVGGGSTEIVVAEAGAIASRVSLPLGSVRLTEKHLKHDPPHEREMGGLAETIAGALREAPPFAAPALVGVAGTVTTLAAMAQDLATYDPARVHGFKLTRPALATQVKRLRRSKQAEREHMPGLDPRRADVILAGAVLLAEIARRAGVPEIVVSDRGIRWGLLQELASAP